MAFNDTLFQLGMDLTRSSTAQTEELGEIALLGAHSDGIAKVRASVKSATGLEAGSIVVETLEPATPVVGTHVTIDIHGDVMLHDFKTAVETLTRLVDDAGANLQHLHVHPVAEGGAVSGVAVLSNGHIAFHSRPSASYAALDVSTFGGSAPHIWTLAAKAAFADCRISVRVHQRGEHVAVGSKAPLSAVLPSRRGTASVKHMRAKAA